VVFTIRHGYTAGYGASELLACRIPTSIHSNPSLTFVTPAHSLEGQLIARIDTNRLVEHLEIPLIRRDRICIERLVALRRRFVVLLHRIHLMSPYRPGRNSTSQGQKSKLSWELNQTRWNEFTGGRVDFTGETFRRGLCYRGLF
jgi:hypothetical protein